MRAHGGAVARLVSAVEADPARRAELTQEIHLQVWRSLAGFNGQCSERTWVLRVAHNVAASHVDAEHRRNRTRPVSLSEAEEPASEADSPLDILDRRDAVAAVHRLVRALPVVDCQVVLLWLEGLAPAEIGEVVGVSANAASVRIHRARAELARRFKGEER
jgi:RNA polymerase sigma-70 factor, ECF subfamily